ncbi:50S ribosomal protein L25 [Candidatus Saccharibacteria bacterium CG10_big_fil_rev_8_21_14_0_10_47_8]|nr:MAG: 50S ribosomal protein L25 [Candidatus Saccharibacteria bacterium CG10_big_fil_rev_8_21_14_0_10_47_8]
MVDLDTPVKLQERTVVRKGLNNLRSEGFVPAVIHNHGQPSVHVMGLEMELGNIYKAAGKHHPLQLQIGSQKYLALIKDAHFNPAKRRLQHIVFQAINQNEKVEAEVPIRLDGEIPAEKTGLMILHQLDHVEIEALPKDLPDELKVDATKLVELQDKITVADLQIPEGVTVLTEPEHPIAMVVETKAQISEEEETTETAEEGEEEVEGAPTEGGKEEAVDKESSESGDQKKSKE